MEIAVTRDVLKAIGRAARAAYPKEACGILTGEERRISGLIETRNVHPTPKTHFEIDPQTLIDAHRRSRGGEIAVLGYFHSHPNGSTEPSATDCESTARDGSIWAIAAQDDVRFYRSGERGFEPLSFTEIDG